MKQFGSVESVKGSIQQKFWKLIDDIDKATQKEIDSIEGEAQKRAREITEKIMERARSEAAMMRAKILNQGKLSAKKAYDFTREEMYKKIFEAAIKASLSLVHTQEYVDYVKSHLPKEHSKDLLFHGDSPYYQKHFKNFRVSRGFTGIKAEEGDIIYDFSIEGIIEARKEALRTVIHRAVYEDELVTRKAETSSKAPAKKHHAAHAHAHAHKGRK